MIILGFDTGCSSISWSARLMYRLRTELLCMDFAAKRSQRGPIFHPKFNHTPGDCLVRVRGIVQNRRWPHVIVMNAAECWSVYARCRHMQSVSWRASCRSVTWTFRSFVGGVDRTLLISHGTDSRQRRTLLLMLLYCTLLISSTTGFPSLTLHWLASITTWQMCPPLHSTTYCAGLHDLRVFTIFSESRVIILKVVRYQLWRSSCLSFISDSDFDLEVGPIAGESTTCSGTESTPE